jgi:hypothetical protein
MWPEMNPAVAWAKKMADVLGNRIDEVTGDPAPKVPKGSGGGGAPTSGAAPANGGAPAANGAPANGTPANGTPTGGAAPAAGDAPAQAPPTAGDPAAAPAGSGAKEQAEAAQQALDKIKPVVADLVNSVNELKKLATDVQAAKKEVDDASRKVDEIEKGIPTPPPLQKPQGADAKAQYDSSIQITGSVRKVLVEAEGKQTDGQAQGGAAEEGKLKVDLAVQQLTKSAEQIGVLGGKVGGLHGDAARAADKAGSAAAESKQKADKAAKDNAADKDALMKTAQEDAKYAAQAKQAATNAQVALKQVDGSVSNAETQIQTATKLQQEAQTTADAAKQKSADLFKKLEPLFEAVGKAELQEGECRAKLSAEDADSVLNQRYIALGGDPELTKVLAAEDQEFEAGTENFRAELKRWQTQRKKELDEYKARLEIVLRDGETFVTGASKWVDTESALADKANSSTQALGEKLQTEPGKELQQAISANTAIISEIKRKRDYNQKLVEKTKAAMEALKTAYQNVDKEYEAGEKFLKDRRTELDNLLQMDGMTLELKVDFLQTRPKPVRDKIKVQLDAELARLERLTILENQLETADHQAKAEPFKRDALDWKAIDAAIAKITAATLEQLKANDPKLADIQAEYDKAGGDQALLNKRVAKWKNASEEVARAEKERSASYQDRSEKLRAQLVSADTRVRELQQNLEGNVGLLKWQKDRHNQLDMAYHTGGGLSKEETAEMNLLAREIKQTEAKIKNFEAQLDAAKSSKESAEKLAEAERQRHEHIVDDDRFNLSKPTSEEINAMPLRAKYTELTGKQPPQSPQLPQRSHPA